MTRRHCFAMSVALAAAAVWPAAFAEGAGDFRFDERDKNYLHLYDGKQPVLTYNFGEILKEGAPKNQRRSSYVHPIYGLDGEALTDDFPRDHYHHRGLFWSWAQVTADGKTYDPWAVSSRKMLKHFDKWLGRETGADFAAFGVDNGWYVGEKKVVDEKVGIRVGRADVVGRAIDVELTLEATSDPVMIGGRPPAKGYGGFGVRFAAHQGRPALSLVTGRAAKDLVRDPSPWSDFSARFHDRATTSGVAMFAHKSHPTFPPGWFLRHYGYVGLTWPGTGKAMLEKGKPITLRYRVYVHRGDAKTGRVAEAYAAYAKL